MYKCIICGKEVKNITSGGWIGRNMKKEPTVEWFLAHEGAKKQHTCTYTN